MTSNLHDAYASDYDSQVRAYGSYLAEVLFGVCYEFAKPGQSLLDLGIGTGLAAALYAQAGLRVHGMDFSLAMLELCRAKRIAVDLKQHDLQNIPCAYSSQAFDHVVCCGVSHFIPELEMVFAETARVLRNGGLFAFTTKSPQLSDASASKYVKLSVGGFDVFTHSPDYLAGLIEQNEFEQIKVLRCFVGQDIFLLGWSKRSNEVVG